MAYTDDIADLFGEGVTVGALSGLSTDGYAIPTYASGSTFAARIVREQTQVRTFEGIDALATTTVWVLSTSTFGPLDEITMPDTSTPTLLAVEAPSDENGVTHSKLFFG